MSSRRKTLDIASMQFYKFDKWLLAEESLKKLSPTAKLLYMVIKDREEISLKNADKFTDKEGYLFQYFDQVKAGELLGISKNAVIKAFKDLQEYKLIEVVRQGQGKPNRLYVLDYQVSEDTLKILSYTNKKASVLPQTEANKELEQFKNSNKNSIPQNNNSNNNYGKKLKTRYHNINQTFKKYSDDELEKLLQESQKDKFEFVPSYGKTNHEN